MLLSLSIVVLQIVSCSHGIWNYGQPSIIYHANGKDSGSPLFLTPFIENGSIAEGQRLARVPFTDNFNITSYAGFFTVDKTFDSNHFFWYFEPTECDREKAPVVVWLQGGPGVSSLYALFKENGPLHVVNGTFLPRTQNWAYRNHLIYIDNPVGTGFSFTNDSKGYCTNQSQIGEHLYTTISQFFQLFPELRKNDFFISGESYAGKYVPAFAYTVHKKNPTAKEKINLKGLAIGNGFTDPVNQRQCSRYWYEIGLIDNEQAKNLQEMEMGVVKFIKQEQWESALKLDSYIWFLFQKASGFSNMYNYLQANETGIDTLDSLIKIQESFYRKGIHVGEQPYYALSSDVYEHLSKDIMKSVAPWMSELLNYYHILVYSGQLDLTVPYPTTVNFLRKLNFTGSDNYPTAERHIWNIGGDIAGYVKYVGKLVEVLVRNAGHMVPADQPDWALDMINSFTSSFKVGYQIK